LRRLATKPLFATNTIRRMLVPRWRSKWSTPKDKPSGSPIYCPRTWNLSMRLETMSELISAKENESLLHLAVGGRAGQHVGYHVADSGRAASMGRRGEMALSKVRASLWSAVAAPRLGR